MVPSPSDNLTPPNLSKDQFKNRFPALQKPVPKFTSFVVLTLFLLWSIALTAWVLLPSPTPLPLIKPNFSPTISQPLFLNLDSPSEGMVTEEGKALIKGTTTPNTVVFFYTENESNSTESDNDGYFEGEIALVGGINTLNVTAFGDNDEEKGETFNLVYDDQVLAAKTEPNKGQAKKAENTPQPATIGNIDKVNKNSIIIEEKKNNKKTEVNIDKNTKIINQNKKVIKPGNLKADDQAAIISTGSGQLTNKKALKIYIREASSSAELKQQKRQAIQGIILSIDGSTITLTHQIQRDRTYFLTVTSTTVIVIKGAENATLADLLVGQRVAAVGDRDENGNLVATRIHVIPGKATGIYEKRPLPTPSVNLTITPTATVSATPSESVSVTPTLSETPTPTLTETPTSTPTITLTPTPLVPTETPTPTI